MIIFFHQGNWKILEMKKLVSLLNALLIIILSCQSVFATENISFELTDFNTSQNRLFSIDMIAKCNTELSAATFEFKYDKSMIEFKSIKANNSKIKYNELDSSVKVSYLCTDGKNINNGDIIFSITFKALNSGNCFVDFSANDCVDSNANFIDIGSCLSANIQIENSKEEKNNFSKSSSASDQNTKNSKNKNSSHADKADDETSDSAFSDLGLLNSIDDKSTRFLIIGIAAGSSIIVISLIGYLIAKKCLTKRRKIENTETDSNDKSSE